MSIATAIQNAQEKVANSYTAVSTKGGTIPATQNLSNLPAAILSIPQGGSGTLKTWYNWSNMDNAQTSDLTALPLSVTNPVINYCNGLYIIGASGSPNCYTSSDSLTWTARSLGWSPTITGIAYGNNVYILTTNSTYCFYSSDASSWTDVEAIPGWSITWEDIVYGAGKFVAISSTYWATTTDGQTWSHIETSIPTETYRAWKAVEYGAGKFVAIASNTNACAYSSNGTSWTLGTLPSSLDWQDIKYANGRFVAVATGTNKYAYSDDGIHWTEGTMPDSNAWKSIAYGQGRFVVFTGSGSSEFAFSYDGIHWETGTITSGASNNVGVYGNVFVVASSGSRKIDRISFSSLAPCYTLEENPTTSSVVYTEPNNPSAYTITSVGTGTITLSNGYTYTYNIGGNLFTY